MVFRYGGSKRKIFVIGGSYPGAMAAWLRYKFPHIFDGALSSSGVVNAVFDFTQFDGQMFTSTQMSSQDCTDVVESMTKQIDDFNSKGDKASLAKLYKAFKADPKMDYGDFMFFFSELHVEKI